MSIARVDRDAVMGWWWVEVWDDEEGRWRKDAARWLGLRTDTYARRERAEALAERIDRAVGLLVALAVLR